MQPDESGCVLWLGGHDACGYARIGHGGPKYVKISRVLMQNAGHVLCPGLCVCHTCDRPGCVNTEHMFLGTHLENMQDRSRKGREARGPKIHTTKLDAARARLILLDDRMHKHIANDFGVDISIVSKIKSRKIWKYVQP